MNIIGRPEHIVDWKKLASTIVDRYEKSKQGQASLPLLILTPESHNHLMEYVPEFIRDRCSAFIVPYMRQQNNET